MKAVQGTLGLLLVHTAPLFYLLFSFFVFQMYVFLCSFLVSKVFSRFLTVPPGYTYIGVETMITRWALPAWNWYHCSRPGAIDSFLYQPKEAKGRTLHRIFFCVLIRTLNLVIFFPPRRDKNFVWTACANARPRGLQKPVQTVGWAWGCAHQTSKVISLGNTSYYSICWVAYVGDILPRSSDSTVWLFLGLAHDSHLKAL